MSRLTDLSLAKRSVTLLLAAALFIAGLSAWGSLKQELLPDIEFPVITVVAPYPGAGAEDVAAQVAEPIERAIAGVPRLESLQSTSANSIALVVAQFSFGTDVDEIEASINENLRTAGLPEDVEPQVSALNINAAPVIIASIAAIDEDGLDEAAELARTRIVPEIAALEGVASADVTGGLEEQLVITLDPAAMADAGVSVQQIQGVLQANNLTFPSGQLAQGGERIPVSTTGEFTSVEAFETLVVGVRQPAGGVPPGAVPSPATDPGASADPTASAPPVAPEVPAAPEAPVAPTPVTLGELATVEVTGLATTGYGRTNGTPSLTLTVTKTSNANTVSVARAVEEILTDIGAENSDLATVTIVSDLSTFITESQDGLLREGGLGALFAILTIFLFLRSIRSTIVAAVSIPLSVLAALVVMQLTGISLNIMTLGGLAVAVGRVVDDAIVVLENIYRHRAMGEDRLTAALRGPREVATAITAATLTTVGVFLPLGFVGGLVSEFFLPFALTVTFALLASLLVALTVVPVLAYLLMGRVSLAVDEHGEPTRSLWVRIYAPAIRWALHSRLTKLAVLAISAVLFIGSLTLVSSLPTQFINAGSEKILQVAVIPPSGASSDAVLDRATVAEEILGRIETVELVQTSVPGEGDTSFQTIIAAQQGQPANSATLTVRLDPSVDLGEASRELSEALEPVKEDGFDVNVSEAAGFTSNGLNVIVSADDPALVESTTASVLEALRDRTDLINLKSDLVQATPEVRITVDPNKAIGAGLTAAQLAGEVRTALTPTTVTSVTLDETTSAIDVVLRLDPESVTSVEDLRELPAPSGPTSSATASTSTPARRSSARSSARASAG